MKKKTELWDKVFNTDPIHTKAFKRAGGFSGTAIKPLYLIHKATEIWGPMGDMWGAESAEYVLSGNTVFIKALLWYPGEFGKAWVEHWGGDILVRGDKQQPNDEAFKMAFTDAVGKCLVQLGFGADVHLGLFDDSKYLSDRKAESAASAKRRISGFIYELKKSNSPSAYWVMNQNIVNECREVDEPDLMMSTLLRAAQEAVLWVIKSSDDPAESWGNEILLITQIKEFPGLASSYQQLVDAGAARKLELQQQADFKEKK